jgi:hypothetical protein
VSLEADSPLAALLPCSDVVRDRAPPPTHVLDRKNLAAGQHDTD